MVYLDNSATTRKKPISVLCSVMKEMIFSANAGRGGHKAGLRVAMKINRTRELICDKFFDGNVVFTKNCTEALNMAILSMDGCKEILVDCFCHNSVLRVVKMLERTKKIKYKVVYPDSEGKMEGAFNRLLTKDTGLVVLTAVSNVTGRKQNVEEIAKSVKERSEAVVLLDGAQSAGVTMFDYTDVDMFATSGHKELLGVQGTGFLLARKKIKLKPLLYGGTGTSSLDLIMPNEVPEALEAGTVNAPGIVSMYFGIKHAFLFMRKTSKKFSHWTKILLYFWKDCQNIKVYGKENGIVSFNIIGISSNELSDILSNQYGIYVRGGYHCAPLAHTFLGTAKEGAVRISFGRNNSIFGVVYCSLAIRKLSKKLN